MNRERSPDERRATAFHEAGHAVALLEFGVHFDKVSILPERGMAGFVKCAANEGSTGEAGRLIHNLHEVVVDLAGPIAQGMAILGTPFVELGAGVGLTDDRTMAATRCQTIVNDFLCVQSSSGTSPEAAKIQYVLYLAAAAVVENRWPEIEAVADTLLERCGLTESQVADLCDGPEARALAFPRRSPHNALGASQRP